MPIESHVHTTVESESEKFISSSISCVTGAGAAGVPGIPVFANSHSFIGHSSDGTDFDIGITKIPAYLDLGVRKVVVGGDHARRSRSRCGCSGSFRWGYLGEAFSVKG